MTICGVLLKDLNLILQVLYPFLIFNFIYFYLIRLVYVLFLWFNFCTLVLGCYTTYILQGVFIPFILLTIIYGLFIFSFLSTSSLRLKTFRPFIRFRKKPTKCRNTLKCIRNIYIRIRSVSKFFLITFLSPIFYFRPTLYILISRWRSFLYCHIFIRKELIVFLRWVHIVKSWSLKHFGH